MMPETTIVVPSFNEAARLQPDAFREFVKKSPSCEFLFVDDGSQDETRLILECLEQSNGNRFQVLRLEQNQGKAEAVRQGLIRAIQGPAAYVGFWDADLATPLDAIPEFLDVFEERPDLQAVVGSRVKLLGRKIDRTAFRHYAGRVFATFASLVLGIPIYDTQCGAKLFRADAALQEVVSKRFLTTWIFDVELIARYGRAVKEVSLEDMIYELPLRRWTDVAGSKLKPKDFCKAVLELNRVRRIYPSPTRGRAKRSKH